MNYSTAVMLINEKIRAIKIIYETDEENPKQARPIFKTLDTTIKKGDLVVVPTDSRHKMTVVKVDEVDVEVDFDSTTKVNWIIDKVNVADSITILAAEASWIEAIKESEKKKKRDEIKKNMLDTYGEGLVNLPIATMAVLEHKK